jgi:hypothetical protein
MAENASASLPAKMQTWKETIALYRLLDEEDVTFEALMQPHWQQTREQIESQPVVLLMQDTSEVDLSHHPKTKVLGEARQRARTRAVSADGPGRPAREWRGPGLRHAGTLCAHASPTG